MELEELNTNTETLEAIVADNVGSNALFCVVENDVMDGWAMVVAVVENEDAKDRKVSLGEVCKSNDGVVIRTSVDHRGKNVVFVVDEFINGSTAGFGRVDDNKDDVVTGATTIGNDDVDKDLSPIMVASASDDAADTPREVITDCSDGDDGSVDAAKDSDPKTEG